MNHIFIIEHLEKELYPWCFIEYKNISKIVGKENLVFMNLEKIKGAGKLNLYGLCFSESVQDFLLDPVCVLDPAAEMALRPHEAKKFRYFIFGGILGDEPPKQRTKAELTPLLPKAAVRNIGKEQMSTDNAVRVVKEIIDGKKLGELKFQDGIEIRINDVESILLPYRYRVIKGKPFISKELVRYLKKK